MTTTAPITYRVEPVVWNQLITATNGKEYYMLSHLLDARTPTLVVTLKGGNGGAMFMCEMHKVVYPINHGACAECQSQVVGEG